MFLWGERLILCKTCPQGDKAGIKKHMEETSKKHGQVRRTNPDHFLPTDYLRMCMYDHFLLLFTRG